MVTIAERPTVITSELQKQVMEFKKFSTQLLAMKLNHHFSTESELILSYIRLRFLVNIRFSENDW